MKVGIMQPYFFPYLGYWQLINAVDKYVIFDDVNYIKRGWINRNRILYNGEIRYLNVYLKGVSQNKLINEIEIGDQEKNKNNLTIIHHAYNKAPYFKDFYPVVEAIINQNATNVADYNGILLNNICEYLGIKTEVVRSSQIDKDNSLRGQDKILDICKRLNATEYYNAIGGRDLYDNIRFRSDGIDLFFLKTDEICYHQFDRKFEPNLSIIDVLMFNSVEETRKLLDRYQLVK